MAVSDHLARAVMTRLQHQKQSDIFSDVTVVVEKTTYKCHRFLLSACSEFFRATLTSGMREDLTKRVDLKGMSSETFNLVLDCLYKAKNVLDSDNVTNIWHAANLLQIDFLVEDCEMFHFKQLSKHNCVEIYINAKLLDSKKLLKLSWDLIVKEFDYLRMSDQILMLDIEDMLDLISDDALQVQAEDVVIDALMRWVSFDPKFEDEEASMSDQHTANSLEDVVIYDEKQKQKCGHEKDKTKNKARADGNKTDKKSYSCNAQTRGRDGQESTSAAYQENGREKFLPDLLAASKICLVSGTCIQALMDNKMVLEDPVAFSVVQEALRYQLQPGRRHDYCPPYAVHRKTSPIQNVTMAITGVANQPKMSCRTSDGSWFQLAAPAAELLKCKALVYENDIYATCRNATQLGQGFTFTYNSTTNAWRSLPHMSVPRDNCALICLDGYIYAVGGDKKTEIERLCARGEQRKPGSEKWENVGNLKQAVSNTMAVAFGSCIVVFGSMEDSTTSTTIQCFDTQTMSARDFLEDMSGPAKNMVSLRHGSSTYILQETGALWQLKRRTRSKISVEFHGMLWDFSIELFAAVIHNEELLILGNKIDAQMSREWGTTNNALFKRLKIIEREANCFLNNVIKKTLLTTKETQSPT